MSLKLCSDTPADLFNAYAFLLLLPAHLKCTSGKLSHGARGTGLVGVGLGDEQSRRFKIKFVVK